MSLSVPGYNVNHAHKAVSVTLLEEMVLFRTRNGSIPPLHIWNSKMVRTISFGKRFYWPSMEPHGSI